MLHPLRSCLKMSKNHFSIVFRFAPKFNPLEFSILLYPRLCDGAACRCAAALFQVRALLHFCMCSPKQGPKVAKVQDFHKYIWVYSWLQAESHCLGRLWSKVWAQFSLHTLAKDLLTSKPACRHMQDTQKRSGHETHREAEKREKKIRSSSCSVYLLKNVYMTSVHSSWFRERSSSYMRWAKCQLHTLKSPRRQQNTGWCYL